MHIICELTSRAPDSPVHCSTIYSNNMHNYAAIINVPSIVKFLIIIVACSSIADDIAQNGLLSAVQTRHTTG